MLSPMLSKADLHLLRVFLVVVQKQGFSAAQVALNVSTSTISRQISDLETRLGMPLCQRGRGGFRLTDKGEAVHAAAQELFGSLGRFSEAIHDAQDALVGHLAMGVIDSWVSNDRAPIVSALSKFTATAPQVSVELHSMAPDDIETGVLDGQISLGIGVFHQHKPGLSYDQIGREFIGLYCGAGHPLFSAKNPAEQAKLLAQAKVAQRAYLKEDRVAPVSRGRLSNATAHQVEGIALLILTGNFIGYLPHSLAELWLRNGRMKSVMDGRFDLPTPIEIVTRRGVSPSGADKAFIRLLKAEAYA
ncbi:MAG: LysR family transcriptional regulator [Rhodobacteraceae bacterium]|nr:LysR family transcriptional regulator [Paracoccaceae bacterium]MCP5342720.1 LysR family transcriptional regulator [Paracoccaceae bacterium]